MIRFSAYTLLTLLSALYTSSTYSQEEFNPDPGASKVHQREDSFYQEEYGLDILPRYRDEKVTDEILEAQKNPSITSPIPVVFHPPEYLDNPKTDSAFPNTERAPNRWQVNLQWKRYQEGDAETPYQSNPTQYTWHPYEQSLLKGDIPIDGKDLFLSLTASLLGNFNTRTLPSPSGISASTAGSFDFYGHGSQIFTFTNFIFRADLFKGETAFKPFEWFVRIEPVLSLNYLSTEESGLVKVDPRGRVGGSPSENPPQPSISGINNPSNVDALLTEVKEAPPSFQHTKHTRRFDHYLALQEALVEIHLLDLSANYDFLAIKMGNQLFNSDFRGLIFNDVNTGLRLFGNAYNNLYQYNLALFYTREKDTNSGLNTFHSRRQTVWIANLYKQDFIRKGYTAELNFVANIDRGDRFYYDKNGFLARPSPLGLVRPHKLQAYYLGWLGDGHIGRWNISHAFYQVWGHDDFNGLAGGPTDISAQAAFLELSYDHNWIRYKATGLFASGDRHPGEGKAHGFDSVTDNMNILGGPFSFFLGQGFNLGGTATLLTQPLSVFPSMTTSKVEGQSNFVNPGILIGGIGTDIEVTQKLRGFMNLSYLRFVTTAPIEKALMTGSIRKPIGIDLNFSAFYRPLLTDNIIFLGGIGLLFPRSGFRDIYSNNSEPLASFGNTSPTGNLRSMYYSGYLSLALTY